MAQTVQQLHRIRGGKTHGTEGIHLREHLCRGAVHDQPAVAHDDKAVGIHGLVHMVGDEHHGDAPFPIQCTDGGEHLAPSGGVQHGSSLVQHDALRGHGDDTGDGHPLLLAAGQQMGRVAGEFRHAHRRQGVIHPLADLIAGDAQILRCEGHILLHHVGNDLVIRILEHHAHTAADLQQEGFILRIHALYIHRAAGGQQHRVHMLGQSGFAGAVMTQHHHEAALFNGQRHILQRRGGGAYPLLRRVGEGEVLGLQHS